MKLPLRKQIETEQKKLNNYLQRSGLRLSKGRQSVFDEVMNAHGHFTAEELVKHCKDSKCKVSRATIYRSLHELLEACIIRETAFGDKHHHFEHVYDERPHHHAQCIRCHKFIEFPDRKEDEIYKPFLEQRGFKILGHEMHFYGICRECQRTDKNSAKEAL